MKKAKKILKEQMKEKGSVKFIEWAEVVKARRKNDIVCAQLRALNNAFGMKQRYVNPDLRGKEALVYIFAKIMRRQAFLRAMSHLETVAKKFGSGAIRQ